MLKKFHFYAEKPWFSIALSFLAVLDNFVFIVPLAAIMVGAIVAVPRKWLRISFSTIAGNTVGATLFSYLISLYGMPFIQKYAAHLTEMQAWEMSKNWVDQYGLWALFLNSVLPTVDHPMVAILTLTGESVLKIAIVLFIAKGVKYLVLGWIASFAPHLLKRLNTGA